MASDMKSSRLKMTMQAENEAEGAAKGGTTEELRTCILDARISKIASG